MHIHAQTFIYRVLWFFFECALHTYQHMLIHMHPHAHMHTYMQIRTHTRTYMHIHAHTCSNIHFIACFGFFLICIAHIRAHAHSHNTCMHTQTWTHLQTIWLNCDTENSRYYAWGWMWHESFRQCTRDIPRAQSHAELTVSFKSTSKPRFWWELLLMCMHVCICEFFSSGMGHASKSMNKTNLLLWIFLHVCMRTWISACFLACMYVYVNSCAGKCMYVCVRSLCELICMHVCVREFMRVDLHACMRSWIYARWFACMYAYVNLCACICICISICR